MTTFAKSFLALLFAVGVTLGAAACGSTAEEAGIPKYQPSTVVTETVGSTVLTTPDSVEQVERFYADFIKENGWQTVSHAGTGPTANFTIKKSGQGANISISALDGSETTISISTYPSP